MSNNYASIGLGIAGAVIAAKLLERAIKNCIDASRPYDSFDNVISFSSRLIAAARAFEAEEEHPLVFDPLASALAGRKALDSSRKRQQPAPKGSGRKHKINKMAIRTKWFDDQLQASLGMPMGTLITLDNYLVKTVEDGDTPPRQVVILGSGMDSRPWRLKLPAGLHWFEIDREDVLSAKENILSDAGAEVEPKTPMRRRVISQNTLLENKIGVLDRHAVGGGSHPLRSETWVGVATDLDDAGWLSELRNSGFDLRKKTIWLVEGLLMYLSPERALSLLQEISDVSAPGSVLLANNVMQTVIDGVASKNGAASELMSTWQFGWPADMDKFMTEAGWTLRHSTNRAKIANALKLPAELCSFPTDPTMAGDRASLFIVGTV